MNLTSRGVRQRAACLWAAGLLLMATAACSGAGGGSTGAVPSSSSTATSASSSIRNFIAVLNRHDLDAAMRDLAPTFSLSEANGQVASGANAKPLLQGLATPISIVSLTTLGQHRVHTMLQFGSQPAVPVDFTGSSTGATAAQDGKILTMKLGAP